MDDETNGNIGRRTTAKVHKTCKRQLHDVADAVLIDLTEMNPSGQDRTVTNFELIRHSMTFEAEHSQVTSLMPERSAERTITSQREKAEAAWDIDDSHLETADQPGASATSTLITKSEELLSSIRRTMKAGWDDLKQLDKETGSWQLSNRLGKENRGTVREPSKLKPYDVAESNINSDRELYEATDDNDDLSKSEALSSNLPARNDVAEQVADSNPEELSDDDSESILYGTCLINQQNKSLQGVSTNSADNPISISSDSSDDTEIHDSDGDASDASESLLRTATNSKGRHHEAVGGVKQIAPATRNGQCSAHRHGWKNRNGASETSPRKTRFVGHLYAIFIMISRTAQVKLCLLKMVSFRMLLKHTHHV